MNNVIEKYLDRVDKDGYCLTSFLDFEQIKLISNLSNKIYNIVFFGGWENAERLRAHISYQNTNIDNPNFHINILQYTYNNRFRTLNHRQVLGTIMSLGVKRETFGDIVINEQLQEFYLFCEAAMSNFLLNNLIKVNNIEVSGQIVDSFTKIMEDTHQELLINIASMRLDVIISKVLNCSRNNANDYVNKGLVLINHSECLNNAYQCKIGEILSIRHFGRVEILDIIKTTRKDRLVIKIKIKH